MKCFILLLFRLLKIFNAFNILLPYVSVCGFINFFFSVYTICKYIYRKASVAFILQWKIFRINTCGGTYEWRKIKLNNLRKKVKKNVRKINITKINEFWSVAIKRSIPNVFWLIDLLL